MASLVAKKKGKRLYYYVVDSARVDGRPRIVHQAYLGSAEKVAALVKDRTTPPPPLAPPHHSPWSPPLWSSACPARSGWRPGARASLSCSSLYGPPLAPAPRRRIIS